MKENLIDHVPSLAIQGEGTATLTTSEPTVQEGVNNPTDSITPPMMAIPNSRPRGAGMENNAPSFPFPGQDPKAKAIEMVHYTLARAISL